MATILKGYRGQSNPEDPIKSITQTYAGTLSGGGGTDPDEAEATGLTAKELKSAAKHERLVKKAEEKGKSDRWKVRKGVEEDPVDDPAYRSRYNLKGEGLGMKKKSFGGIRNEEGKIKKPHISIEKSQVEQTTSPQGRPNPFHGMSTKNKIKNRLGGFGPKSEHWKQNVQADWSEGDGQPHLKTKGKHGKLPTGKTKTKRKLHIDWK